MMSTERSFPVTDLGTLNPGIRPVEALYPGEVGFVGASIKNVKKPEGYNY